MRFHTLISLLCAGLAASAAIKRAEIEERQFPTDFPFPFPTEFPTEFPFPFPTEFPTEFPFPFPTEFPTEFPFPFPTNLPGLETPSPTTPPVIATPFPPDQADTVPMSPPRNS